MTRLTTPTENLVRIPFEGLTDFQPLALAPGLPMLDVNKLTYQILLGWFGNLLAEPELSDDGVVFHAQQNGQRQVIVERSLATSEELDGSLQPEFEKLKKSLFDVRPVSPSERIIFNRLQPPIGNHDGFLYRILTEAGDEQLVWCWGFQRRTQYGDARLCNNPDCSMLFLHDSLADPQCPHCGTSFARANNEQQPAGSRFSIRKTSTAAAAMLLAGGTFWISSHFSNLSADTAADITDIEPFELEQPSASYEDTARPATPTREVASSDAAEPKVPSSKAEVPELFVAFNNLPEIDSPDSRLITDSDKEDVALPEPPLPSGVSLPDLSATPEAGSRDRDNRQEDSRERDNPVSENATALPDEVVSIKQPENEQKDLFEPDESLPVVKADNVPQKPGSDDDGLPIVQPELTRTQTVPAVTTQESAATSLPETPGSSSSDEPVTRPALLKPSVTDSPDSIAESESVENPTPDNTAETLKWHRDYLAAYVEASLEKRYLLMFFREAVVGGEPLISTDSVFAPSLRPILEQFSRVELPLNAAMPAPSHTNGADNDADLPNILLKHRSFRHLGARQGIAIVDLTDPASLNYARVVSVLPLPESGPFNSDELTLTLNLPKGSISQRTLLFAIRKTIPDSNLSMREFSPTLIELARRNSRYMANAGQAGHFDQEIREQRIEAEFGPQAELKELVFATESDTTIHDAALQAVTSWIGTPESFEVLDTPATAMGMEMFQNSESGRWFVTCFVVR
ncbi:MAG: hypothetical protein HQ518_10495 [Rhodopirellula sp.]|nr:hypothetical protein [Rhodopirellula sp.]